MVVALLERLGPDDRVLVIDDDSPDGTGEIADRLAAEQPRVSVLHRAAKEGLGPAYIAGFRRALGDGAELVLEMDCDFSHDPGDVPRLIEAAADADLVLGSRYADGGRIENWGGLRRFVSRAGSLYAQALLIAPNEASLEANMGLSFAMSNDLGQAEAHLRKAVTMQHATSQIRQNLALVVGLQGRFEEARKLFAAELPPEQVEANMSYVRALLTQQNRWDLIKGAKS